MPPYPGQITFTYINQHYLLNLMFQMKTARGTSSLNKPPIRGGPSKDREDSDDDTSTVGTVTTETTLVDANVKEYQVHYLRAYWLLSCRLGWLSHGVKMSRRYRASPLSTLQLSTTLHSYSLLLHLNNVPGFYQLRCFLRSVWQNPTFCSTVFDTNRCGK